MSDREDAIRDRWEVSHAKMVEGLYDDYRQLSTLLAQREETLIGARQDEIECARALKEAKKAYDDEVAAMLVADERANGKNDTERKRNADALIVAEQQPGGKLCALWIALQHAEWNASQATVAKESAIDSMSAIRNASRMCAGMGHALGA